MNAAFRHVILYVYKNPNSKGKFLVQVIYILLMIKNKNLQDIYDNGLHK